MPAALCRYFVNADGQISIPPTSDIRCPKGWIEQECRSLRDIDRLVERLDQIEIDKAERAGMLHQIAWGPKLQQIREDLLAKMHSAAIDEFNREFIREWLKLSDEHKKETHEKLFEHRRLVCEMREFDKPRNAEEILGESL